MTQEEFKEIVEIHQKSSALNVFANAHNKRHADTLHEGDETK